MSLPEVWFINNVFEQRVVLTNWRRELAKRRYKLPLAGLNGDTIAAAMVELVPFW